MKLSLHVVLCKSGAFDHLRERERERERKHSERVPIRWNGESLRGTQQGEILSSSAIVTSELGVTRELWLLRGDRF